MKFHINWDAMGITATLACAIHCALLPLFLSSLPLFGMNIIHNPFFEGAMIFLALMIGSFALWHGYRRHHHRWLPLGLFVGGMLFLVAKQFTIEYAQLLLIPAVVLIISAHYLNWRLCRKAKHCHHSDCVH
jgi:hypothetical protein